ncbi:hypothetical protein [Gilliamella sp. wkB112]|uniref:hypothetical protein n=1 Tax=Gilliamella sp. wkB112 TaxID=3120257 RepID=UPI00080EC38E|nr:hypothetical protein [Gilliamella apicola]OCG02868.1 hypothetical protein A9G12_08000 [Gilliamella apicola]
MKKLILTFCLLFNSCLILASNSELEILINRHVLTYGDYLKLYNSGNKSYQNIAISNLKGVMDGVSMTAAKAAVNYNTKLFCIPDNVTISDKDAMKLMENYVLSFPQHLREKRLDVNLSTTYIFALDFRYPCNK